MEALKHCVTNTSFIRNFDFLQIFLGQCDNMTGYNPHWRFSNQNIKIDFCFLFFLLSFLGQCDNMTGNNSHWFFSNQNTKIQYFDCMILIVQMPITQKIWSFVSLGTVQYSQNIFPWLLTFVMQCGSEWNSRLPQCPLEFQFTPVSITIAVYPSVYKFQINHMSIIIWVYPSVHYNFTLRQCPL